VVASGLPRDGGRRLLPGGSGGGDVFECIVVAHGGSEPALLSVATPLSAVVIEDPFPIVPADRQARDPGLGAVVTPC